VASLPVECDFVEPKSGYPALRAYRSFGNRDLLKSSLVSGL
jgi:hypothetical protein